MFEVRKMRACFFIMALKEQSLPWCMILDQPHNRRIRDEAGGEGKGHILMALKATARGLYKTNKMMKQGNRKGDGA